MKKTGDELKARYLVSTNKQTRLSIQIPTRTANLITEYQTFYKEVSKEEVTIDAVVSAMLSSALTLDKSFGKWRKNLLEKNANSGTEKAAGNNTSQTKREEEVKLDIS